jgi:hypothetical protein
MNRLIKQMPQSNAVDKRKRRNTNVKGLAYSKPSLTKIAPLLHVKIKLTGKTHFQLFNACKGRGCNGIFFFTFTHLIKVIESKNISLPATCKKKQCFLRTARPSLIQNPSQSMNLVQFVLIITLLLKTFCHRLKKHLCPIQQCFQKSFFRQDSFHFVIGLQPVKDPIL